MNDKERAGNDDALKAQFEQLMRKHERPTGEPPKARRGSPSEDALREGSVAGITGNDVFIDLGEREQGVIPLQEFDEPPDIGQRFQFTLVDFDDDLWHLTRREARTLETWDALSPGKWVSAKVTGTNKGGLELAVGPLRAFMPFSQAGVKSADQAEEQVGQEMICQVLEVDRADQKVVLSRRKVLDEERRKAREESAATLAEGKVIRGTIEKIEPFGAFVTIGEELSGLLHVSNISHQRVEDPASVLQVGQSVEVQVLEIREGGRRISLGMKQLQAHPWDGIEQRLPPGRIVPGRVTRTADFGAFVELEPGVEGLLHISQLGLPRNRRVHDALAKGDELSVRIQSIDLEQRRMSLSRLTENGAILGSEEDITEADLGEAGRTMTRDHNPPTSGTNLGSMLRDAMDKGKGSSSPKKRR